MLLSRVSQALVHFSHYQSLHGVTLALLPGISLHWLTQHFWCVHRHTISLLIHKGVQDFKFAYWVTQFTVCYASFLYGKLTCLHIPYDFILCFFHLCHRKGVCWDTEVWVTFLWLLKSSKFSGAESRLPPAWDSAGTSISSTVYLYTSQSLLRRPESPSPSPSSPPDFQGWRLSPMKLAANPLHHSTEELVPISRVCLWLFGLSSNLFMVCRVDLLQIRHVATPQLMRFYGSDPPWWR